VVSDRVQDNDSRGFHVVTEGRAVRLMRGTTFPATLISRIGDDQDQVAWFMVNLLEALGVEVPYPAEEAADA
jgi:hypothetical protein